MPVSIDKDPKYALAIIMYKYAPSFQVLIWNL